MKAMPYRISILIFGLLALASTLARAQTYTRIQPLQADGYPIEDVSIWLKDSVQAAPVLMNDPVQLERFYRAFGIRPGAVYNQFLMSAAVKRIEEEPNVASAEVLLFNTQINGSIWIRLEVVSKDTTAKDTAASKSTKGMLTKNGGKDFPVLYENQNCKLTFLLNGGVGLFNDVNAFLGEGTAFTQGNPIADDPAGRGVRFWGEAFVEPGIAGITRLGKSPAYVYGAVSALFSGRNSSDAYSFGPAAFADFERLYAGVLLANIGKRKNLTIDISAGRNFFQLNDAFLISRISGSANAGPRASVYLSSRTAFQKTILASIHKKNLKASFFLLEPEELFKSKQQNTRMMGGSLDWVKKPHYEIGLTYLTINGGTANYSTPTGAFAKDGMYLLNPKVWIKKIFGTGAYFKSEYVYQTHRKEAMNSNAWYVGAGYETQWKFKPSLYYRYAFMSGDNPSTSSYERFDPLLTGGLGLWVQGINYRKLIGNGNIISHRIQAQAYLKSNWDVSLDYFFLSSDELLNQGSLAPITNLKSKDLGQEFTLSTRYYLNSHFMVLGIFSHAFRGQAMNAAFNNEIYDWTTFQVALFMFY